MKEKVCESVHENTREEKRPVDPTPLGNITTGIVLLTLWPILFGLADTSAMVAVLPWALAAAPMIVLTSAAALRAGNVLGAVANGVLSGVTLCQNAVWGGVVLFYTACGRAVPEGIAAAKGLVDGAAFLSTAFMLFCLVLIFLRIHNRPMAFFMGVICTGFCCMCLSDLGVANLRLPAGVCIVCFASWMIYSGCAMLMHAVLGKKLLPY